MGKIIEENFEEIYNSTYSQVLKYIIINCYNFNDVNDIIQDTYIEFLKKNKKKELIIDNIENYLCVIAKNIIKRYYCNKKKIREISDYDSSKIDIKDDFDLEDKFITKENIKEIWEYIVKKDIVIAKIFYLYFVNGLKITEISNELNLSESNVKHKLYRTINELRNNLGKDVIKDEE